jgi:two-component system response regulator QseB
MKILVVEDDPLLGQGILDALAYQSHLVEWITTGKQAITFATASQFDVIILDLGLPDIDGLSVIKKLRAKNVTSPILILTARDSSGEKVKGLDLGADDYMVKPFDLPELMARLRALQRREIQQKSPTLKHSNIEINPANYTVMQNDLPVNLSRHEFDLLQHLMARPTQVFSREALADKLYNWDNDVGSNTVEVYIHHLRKKLGRNIIKTTRGIGYQLGGTLD